MITFKLQLFLILVNIPPDNSHYFSNPTFNSNDQPVSSILIFIEFYAFLISVNYNSFYLLLDFFIIFISSSRYLLCCWATTRDNEGISSYAGVYTTESTWSAMRCLAFYTVIVSFRSTFKFIAFFALQLSYIESVRNKFFEDVTNFAF